MSLPELSNSGVPQGPVDVLAEIYRAAAVKMREVILHPPGKTASAQQFNAGRAAQQLRQVEQLIAALKAQVAGWVGDKRDRTRGPLTKAVKEAIAFAGKQARDAGVRVDGQAMQGSFSLVDRRTVEAFAKEIYADLGGAADAMGKTAKRVLRVTAQQKLSESDLDKILAGGVIAGKPVQTIRDLRDALKAVHGQKVIVTDKNGQPMTFDVGYYASLVARTKTREATVHARHARLQELGLALVAVIGRISKNFCSAYLGRVFSLDGKSTKYPSISELPQGGPPFHPNCSKSTRPFVEELASGKQLENAQGVEDSDKLLGVDAATAQRRYQDLQLHQAVKSSYQTTADKLFGAGSEAA